MDDSSLDFLDQLVPGGARSEGDAAPSMRQGRGRSLPPPPPSVVTASQRPRADIDIDVDMESRPANEVPSAPPPSNQVPMPEGRTRTGRPPGPATSRPPPPPSMRPLTAASGPPPPPRPSTGPAALRASAAPPAPPRPPIAVATTPGLPDADEIEEVEAVDEVDDAEADCAGVHAASEQVASEPRVAAAPPAAAPRVGIPAPSVFDAFNAGAGEGAAAPSEVAPPSEDDAPTGVAHDVPEVPASGGQAAAADEPFSEQDAATPHAEAEAPEEDEAPTGVAHAVPEEPPSAPAARAPVVGRAGPSYSPGTSAPPAPPIAPMVVGSSLPPPPPIPAAGPTSLPPPPAAPSAPPAAGPPPSSASEWDDAPTTVYARDSLQPGYAPPVSASAHSLPAAPTIPGMRAPRVDTLPPRRDKSSKLYIALAGVAAAALALVFIPFGPEQGELVINVAGTDGIAVDGVKVYLDDKLICEDSPCQVGELEAVGHVVTAEAEGYNKTAAMAVLVKPDDTTIHNVELVKAKSNTGVSIPKTPGEEIELSIDGKEYGKLPQRLDDLEPGKHTLSFTGGERYGTLERQVNLEDGKILALEPVKLPVVKGIAKFTAGEHAEDAEVTLDGKAITLPHSAELSGKKTHRLVATKEGFDTFEREFEFEPGEPELSIEVELSLEGSVAEIDADEAVASAAPASATRSSTRTRAVSTKRTSSTKKASGGGKLTLLSVPPVMVIVDGKPVGKTPKRAMSVSAGTHSVVFVHPSKGRKRASAKVTPGGSKTVAVRF